MRTRKGREILKSRCVNCVNQSRWSASTASDPAFVAAGYTWGGPASSSGSWAESNPFCWTSFSGMKKSNPSGTREISRHLTESLLG